ncbi:MAG: hypothetical protein IJU13_04190 [Bacteroidales bacterium]|nr:hypothetical protein [Bacteroidales bacterium]
MMDIVIAYVNGKDPAWQQVYRVVTRKEPAAERFRDWGTLPFLLRGLAECLPGIGNVHLVVSDESQVPAWINRKTVRIVCHKEIIPSRFLPIFNSSSIELFLHHIPGLAERFVYFNDDMFVMGPCSEEDFFPQGKPRVWCRHFPDPAPGNIFRLTCRNTYRAACEAAALQPDKGRFLKPQHAPSPMLRSVNEQVYRKILPEILSSISKIREEKNINQYLYLCYYWLSGIGHRAPQDFSYLELGDSLAEILSAIRDGHRRTICINDKGVRPGREESTREALLKAFSNRFPDKSIYEL